MVLQVLFLYIFNLAALYGLIVAVWCYSAWCMVWLGSDGVMEEGGNRNRNVEYLTTKKTVTLAIIP